jgi:hypothetical protein
MAREVTPVGAGASSAATGEAQGTARPWWGRWELADGEGGIWHVGPLALAVERRPQRWRIGWERDRPRRDPAAPDIRVPVAATDLPPLVEAARFATRDGATAVRLEPALPDRALVAWPETTLHVLGGEPVSLYVPVPLSVSVLAGDRQLMEIASRQLRETWLGSSTVRGQLCWAAPNPAHLRASQTVQGDSLAGVRVDLLNRASTPLLVERVSVPVTNLRLWWQPEHGLVADTVAVQRDADGDLASLRIAEQPPSPDAVLVAPARQPEPRLGLVRALEALFG